MESWPDEAAHAQHVHVFRIGHDHIEHARRCLVDQPQHGLAADVFASHHGTVVQLFELGHGEGIGVPRPAEDVQRTVRGLGRVQTASLF